MKRNNRKRAHADGDIEDASKRTKLSPLEDCFSSLPDDCLLDVFKRLNHNDLDRLVPACKRMSGVVGASRSRVQKFNAFQLHVVQEADRQFHFGVASEIGPYSATITEINMKSIRFKQMRLRNFNKESGAIFKSQSISRTVTERAAMLLSRFDFKICSFHCLSIDNYFLDFIEQVTASSSFTTFELDCCYFDIALSSTGRDRLKSIILAAKPSNLRLVFCYDAPIFDGPFLTALAGTNDLLSLMISAENDVSTRQYTDDQFAEILFKFERLAMPSLIVDTKWLMPSIVMRLKKRKEGFWKIGLTRDLSQTEILFALDDDLDCTPIRHGLCVQIAGTPHRVEFYIHQSKDLTMWMFLGNFLTDG